MSHGFFITGTDTGIGKTVVSAAMIRHFVQEGRRVAGLKPIASGFEMIDGRLQNEDVRALEQESNVSLPASVVNRYGFTPAIAPHIAADKQACQISLRHIKEDVESAKQRSDMVVVEGVGGWLVPLSGRGQPYQDIESLAVALKLPVILVVGLRLGCLNHALMTAKLILNAGVPFAGWIANHVEREFLYSKENLATLEDQMPVPKLFELAHGAKDLSGRGFAFDTILS